MKVTDQGVPLNDLVGTIKASIKRAGVSRTSQAQDLRVASVQLVLNVVASNTVGGGLDFHVPFVGMRLSLGAKVTKKDTHAVEITLVPPGKGAAREVRGGEDVEEALVNAIEAIRAVMSQAAEGDDPWELSDSTIDISFAITRTGSISIGADGELSGELTNTLRLKLTSPADG